MTTWENRRRQVGPFRLQIRRLGAGHVWSAVTSCSFVEMRDVISAHGWGDTEADAMAAADAWALETIRAMSEAMGVSDGPE